MIAKLKLWNGTQRARGQTQGRRNSGGHYAFLWKKRSADTHLHRSTAERQQDMITKL
jgi:hypothetical protein